MKNSEKAKTIGYYAILNTSQSSGVNKKVNQFISSINKTKNFASTLNAIPPGFLSTPHLALRISLAKEDIIYIRGNSYGLFITLLGMIACKIRRKKIILEIPSPQTAIFKEINEQKSSITTKTLKYIGLLISGPWCFIPTDRIIEYGNESKWFSLLSKKKIFLIGNGCDVESIEKITSSQEWPTDQINLIMVANFSKTHGADLLIKSIANFNSHYKKKFFLSIVGDGEIIQDLKKLSSDLGLYNHIEFTGPLYGSELADKYKKSHIAVGALALHRVGQNFSSALKLREYCATGLPFFFSGIDPDFLESSIFTYSIPSVESTKEIENVLLKISSRTKFPSADEIRDYAKKHLDYKNKISIILEDI